MLKLSAGGVITRVQSKVATSAGTNGTTLNLDFDNNFAVGNTLVCFVSGGGSWGHFAVNCTAQGGPMQGKGSASSTIQGYMFFGEVVNAGARIALTCQTSSPLVMVAAEYNAGTPLWLDTGVNDSGAATTSPSISTVGIYRNNPSTLLVAGIAARNNNGGTSFFSAPTNSWAIVDQTNTSVGGASADRAAVLLEIIRNGTIGSVLSAGVTAAASGTFAGNMFVLEPANSPRYLIPNAFQ